MIKALAILLLGKIIFNFSLNLKKKKKLFIKQPVLPMSSSKFECCVICLEDRDVGQIFSVDVCNHRYCFTCMKHHVKAKLEKGMFPTCPHESCSRELQIASCEKFLPPELLEIMTQRVREASIPVTEKIYCPYPKCSALMSKTALVCAVSSGAMACSKCSGRFCISCKVPWHSNISCSEYQGSNPFILLEDAKVKNLAATNKWRQCVKCNHMIEFAAGCFHMTCRCGHQFCYKCGGEWKDKKATCSCPLWDEQYIIYPQFMSIVEVGEDAKMILGAFPCSFCD